jgi:hypothetical protein
MKAGSDKPMACAKSLRFCGTAAMLLGLRALRNCGAPGMTRTCDLLVRSSIVLPYIADSADGRHVLVRRIAASSALIEHDSAHNLRRRSWTASPAR